MRNFVERLIAYETKGQPSSKTDTRVAFPINEKLRPHLSTLMGTLGFSALVSRALVLAGTEVPWLRTLQVKPDGTLAEVDGLEAQLTPGEILEGRVVLLGELFGLLVAFIGESLTLRLVRDVWPKVTVYNLDFNEVEKHEKTK